MIINHKKIDSYDDCRKCLDGKKCTYETLKANNNLMKTLACHCPNDIKIVFMI